jgi:hypothetical protein
VAAKYRPMPERVEGLAIAPLADSPYAFQCVGDGMAKPKRGAWSMKHDRELMALGKTKSLEVIADQIALA